MPLPKYLQGSDTWRPLADYQQQLGGMFDTSDISSNYEGAISSQFDSGRAMAAAAASQYQNRAQQVGASGLGAGYASGQAMLPAWQQANTMRADLASKQLQARTQQAGIGADLASRIGQLQSARQGQLFDYTNQQRNRAQSSLQFGQDLDYRNRALAQNQSQFTTSEADRNSQFGQTYDLQNRQLAAQTNSQSSNDRLRALQLAMQTPRNSYSWSTDNSGNPINMSDQKNANAFGQQQAFFNNIRNQIGNYF